MILNQKEERLQSGRFVSDDDDDEEEEFRYKGVMTLPPRVRELLNTRARLSLVYAATWGLGGALNSTDKRRFFDSILRDAITQFFETSSEHGNNSNANHNKTSLTTATSSSSYSVDLPLDHDCSVFDCVLLLEEARMVQAFQRDPRHPHSVDKSQQLVNAHVPEKYLDHHLYCEWQKPYAPTSSSSLSSNVGSCDRIIFRTVGIRAVDQAFRSLLSAGANILFCGVKNSGKTLLIQEVLRDLRSNVPTPEVMRRQVYDHLVSIVNGAARAEGIFRSLEMVQRILLQEACRTNVNPDLLDDFNAYWQRLGHDLTHHTTSKAAKGATTNNLGESNMPQKYLAMDDARGHLKARTVTSASTTFRGAPGAQSLRAWLSREFATETAQVLETARFTYGLAFVDDLHYLADSADVDEEPYGEDESNNDEEDINASSSSTRRSAQSSMNRPEELLRGIVDGFPAFNLARQLSVRQTNSLGYHRGSHDCGFTSSAEAPALLHQEESSDIRICLRKSDNYMLQRMGLVTAATGHAHELYHRRPVQTLLSKFATVSLPSFSVSDLHIALITGALFSMAHGISNLSGVAQEYQQQKTNILDVLQLEVVELSRITLFACARMVSSQDYALTTSLERILRSSIVMDISLVATFCQSLRHGSHSIHNPGALLQLYVHEWKRVLLDPLPQGAQRERMVHLLAEQVEQLDETKWCVKRDFLTQLQGTLAARTREQVWANVDVFAASIDQMEVGGAPTRIRTRTISVEAADLQDNDDPASGLKSVPFEYLPVELAVGERAKSTAGISSTVEGTVDFRGFLTVPQIKRLLYPAAFNHVLRIVRVLSLHTDIASRAEANDKVSSANSNGDLPSSIGQHKKSLLLAGYPGSTATLAIQLAAKLCQLEVKVFSVQDAAPHSVMETPPSERAQIATAFSPFLKAMILRAAGLSDAITTLDDVNVQLQRFPNQLLQPGLCYYTVQPQQKILAVLQDAQHLQDDDRRALLHVVDGQDPSWLFDDAEIQGMFL